MADSLTCNQAPAYSSTGHSLLNLFYGVTRNISYDKLVNLLEPAWEEYPEWIFPLMARSRNFRPFSTASGDKLKGDGSRNPFILFLSWYRKKNPKDFLRVVDQGLIEKIGCWKDHLILSQIEPGYKRKCAEHFCKQLLADYSNSNNEISLCAKWAPTACHAGRVAHRGVYQILKYLVAYNLNKTHKKINDYTASKIYRKFIKSLRGKLNLIETKLTNKDYESIDLDKIPAKAFQTYGGAFSRNIRDKYLEFLNSGDIKTTGLDLVGIFKKTVCQIDESDDKLFRKMVNEVSSEIEDPLPIVVADTSGSMLGTPMAISVGLAVFNATVNANLCQPWVDVSEVPQFFKDEYPQGTSFLRGKFMVYSNDAHWNYIYTSYKTSEGETCDIKLKDILKTVEYLVQNTNFQAVVNTLIEDPLDYPAIVIISDMQFDYAIPDLTNLEVFRKQFSSFKKKMPRVIYWNVASQHNNVPGTTKDSDIILMSGYSQNSMLELKNLISKEKLDPVVHMFDVLNAFKALL